jgi:hypothetical protein
VQDRKPQPPGTVKPQPPGTVTNQTQRSRTQGGCLGGRQPGKSTQEARSGGRRRLIEGVHPKPIHTGKGGPRRLSPPTKEAVPP